MLDRGVTTRADQNTAEKAYSLMEDSAVQHHSTWIELLDLVILALISFPSTVRVSTSCVPSSIEPSIMKLAMQGAVNTATACARRSSDLPLRLCHLHSERTPYARIIKSYRLPRG